jgi:hypothetical protein
MQVSVRRSPRRGRNASDRRRQGQNTAGNTGERQRRPSLLKLQKPINLQPPRYLNPKRLQLEQLQQENNYTLARVEGCTITVQAERRFTKGKRNRWTHEKVHSSLFSVFADIYGKLCILRFRIQSGNLWRLSRRSENGRNL